MPDKKSRSLQMIYIFEILNAISRLDEINESEVIILMLPGKNSIAEKVSNKDVVSILHELLKLRT